MLKELALKNNMRDSDKPQLKTVTETVSNYPWTIGFTEHVHCCSPQSNSTDSLLTLTHTTATEFSQELKRKRVQNVYSSPQ